jgi:hypothetical protein
MESQQEFYLPNISWSLSRVFEQGVWENTTTMSWNRWRPVIFPQDAHMPYDMLVMLDGPANSTSAPNISDFDPSWPVEFNTGTFGLRPATGTSAIPMRSPVARLGTGLLSKFTVSDTWFASSTVTGSFLEATGRPRLAGIVRSRR